MLSIWDRFFVEQGGSDALLLAALAWLQLSLPSLEGVQGPIAFHERMLNVASGLEASRLEMAMERLSHSVNGDEIEALRVRARGEVRRYWRIEPLIDQVRNQSSNSRFDVAELVRRFGALHPEGHLMNSGDFVRVVKRMMPHMDVGAMHDLFDLMARGALDTEAQNTEKIPPGGKAGRQVDFRCLACGLAVVSKGSFYEKMRLCFSAYDTDQRGVLTLEKAQLLVEALCLASQIPEGELEPHPRHTLNDTKAKLAMRHWLLREEPNGDVQFIVFYNAVQISPTLLRCFGVTPAPVSQTQIRRDEERKVRKQAQFDGKGKLKKDAGACEVCQVGCLLM